MVETLYSKPGVVYSDKCFDAGLAEFASEKPRAPKLSPNWRVAEARTDSSTDSRIAKLGGRVLEGILSIPAGYVGNSSVLRFLLPEGLASEYAKIATDMNRNNQWFVYREALDSSLHAFSESTRRGIKIEADEVNGNYVHISLDDFGESPLALALYGGWTGDIAKRIKKVEEHANWLRNFQAVKKNGVRLYVPGDKEVNGEGKPIDTQLWSGGSDCGFGLDADSRNLDDDYGVFGVLD